MNQSGINPRTQLRKALNHLYNPDFLRRSPLLELLGIAERFDAPKVLQRILIQAIETVQYRPAGSRDERRVYYHNLLRDRYVTKLSQESVAEKLGISLRQLAREQDHAIDILATVLAEKYPALAQIIGQQQPGSQLPMEPDLANWSRFAAPTPAIPLRLAYWLENVTSLIDPFAHSKQITIETRLSPAVRGALIHPVALRQTLLVLLHAVLRDAKTKKISIQAKNDADRVSVHIQAENSPSGRNLFLAHEQEVVDQLLEINGGQIDFPPAENGFEAILSLPSFKQSLVVVLDDDPRFLHFTQQVLDGSRYKAVSTSNMTQAIDWLNQYQVDIMLLDVMATDFDGWLLLKELRQSPHLAKLPVIVCTWIGLEEIMHSWEVCAILHKPVPKTTLLSTLGEWVPVQPGIVADQGDLLPQVGKRR